MNDLMPSSFSLMHVATNLPSPNMTLVPTLTRLPGLTKASQTASFCSNNKSSITALVSSFTPIRRAGITFVLLTTKTSLDESSSRICENVWCSKLAVFLSTIKRRDSSRLFNGC